VLEHAVCRMARYLRRRGAFEPKDDAEQDEPDVGRLEASAVSGQVPPAGPQWLRGLRALEPSGLSYHKPLCASLDGFTLHAATRAGALDTAGREALLRYVLRPPIAQERVVPQKSGLVAITLQRAYADGTVAVEMAPLSLLCRLAMMVPPPRFHTVKYAGVLAAASQLRARIAPAPAPVTEAAEAPRPPRRGSYWPWAPLMRRTFGLDVLECPTCNGRMKLLALVIDDRSIVRYLKKIGEPTDAPARAPPRGPPYWASTVLRHKALDDIDRTTSSAFDS
jgi:Putative transposase